MTESFILGLSTGSACLVTCGMVIFPYLMAGQGSVRKITIDLTAFLVTRLLVYLVLATIAWYLGKAIFSSVILKTWVPGILYISFAGMLIWYSIGKNKGRDCPAAIINSVEKKELVPVLLGIVNSIGLCPALLLILTKGATQDTLLHSWLSFIAFFAGSSIWFFPLPFAGMIRKRKVIETVGILATGLAGIIFIVKGLTLLIGGIING
jgi:Cytochrome C biogenesis protein transmembrane region